MLVNGFMVIYFFSLSFLLLSDKIFLFLIPITDTARCVPTPPLDKNYSFVNQCNMSASLLLPCFSKEGSYRTATEGLKIHINHPFLTFYKIILTPPHFVYLPSTLWHRGRKRLPLFSPPLYKREGNIPSLLKKTSTMCRKGYKKGCARRHSLFINT